MSHGDTITAPSEAMEVIASTKDVPVAAYRLLDGMTYAVQFHPEVYHTTDGLQLLHNFVIGICDATGDWTPHGFVEHTVDRLKQELGKDKVVLALSGGVDSSVAALLLDRAIDERLALHFRGQWPAPQG